MGIRNEEVLGTAGLPIFHSLPLMGIRNNLDDLCHDFVPVPHYPSWGLGITNTVTMSAQHLDLITPHGD